MGAGKILKVEGHSGGSNYFGARSRKKFLVPPLFSCAHPLFDGIRGTTISWTILTVTSNLLGYADVVRTFRSNEQTVCRLLMNFIYVSYLLSVPPCPRQIKRGGHVPLCAPWCRRLCRRPPVAQSTFVKWTGWTLAMTLVMMTAP